MNSKQPIQIDVPRESSFEADSLVIPTPRQNVWLPFPVSGPSLITGDVRVMVTTTLGSVAVLMVSPAFSGTILISYFSSVTFCKKQILKIFWFVSSTSAEF